MMPRRVDYFSKNPGNASKNAFAAISFARPFFVPVPMNSLPKTSVHIRYNANQFQCFLAILFSVHV